jgi:endonuclease G
MAPAYGVFSRFGRQAQEETHLMSNVAPQLQKMTTVTGKRSSKTWPVLVRQGNVDGGWADDYAEVWVICGPIYDDNPTYLGTSGRAAEIEIPDQYFKILLDVNEDTGKLRALAYVMSNDATETNGSLEDVSTVNDIERLTGLEFIWAIRDDVEEDIEDDKPAALWISQ